MCDIWEEFRAALCMSGANCRAPPTLLPPDLTGGGDEGSGGEGEEDLLSALPDDVLLFILCRLLSTAAAARTSFLSRRWRRLWAQLPNLWFPLPAEPPRAQPSPRSRRWRRIWAHLPGLRFRQPAEPPRAMPSLAALAQHSAPSLWMLSIVAKDADPGDTAAVLRLAAPRLTGMLFFRNVVPKERKKAEMAETVLSDAIELPCFDRAKRLVLLLGYLRLTLPLPGVFMELAVLHLCQVRFRGACDIGNAFSSARCPSLRELCLFDAQGLSNLAIHSESLLTVHLRNLKGLQQLSVVSPMLRDLYIVDCFLRRQPVVDITAPVLEKLGWCDGYDPTLVQLGGELSQLRILLTSFFADAWYGFREHQHNWGIVMLLQRYRKIPALYIRILYPNKMVYCQYWMEALTVLPVENLHLFLVTRGHAIGSCVFHFLKICTSIRRLFLDIRKSCKEGTACSPDCACDQLHDWESEELCLNSLQELIIFGLTGADYDFTFVERLLGWAVMLKSVTINFDPKAVADEELCEELLDLSRPETCMKIYLYRNGAKVMYTPVG